MKKTFIILFLTIFSLTVHCQETLRFSTSGSVNFNNSLYTIEEAGLDFPTSIVSESFIYVSFEYINFFDRLLGTDVRWSVYINKSDVNWNNNLILELKRNGNGTKASVFGPSPTINHGTNYQTITNNPIYFFRGRYGIINIPLGFRLNGASVTMGANQFETTLVFTIYDSW